MVSDPRRTVYNTARIAVGGAFVLILAGALVTSRDAGLSVPDWPLAFGQINPPGWWRIESVRTEHGHRILAFLVALWTAFLTWRVFRFDDRSLARRLAASGALLLIVQALLGGLRVLRLSVDLAMVHGLLGQIFFALLTALAIVTAPDWETRQRVPATPRERRLTTALVATVVVQLGFGIYIRHLGAAAHPLSGTWMYYAHIGIAGIVLSIALDLHRKSDPASRPSGALLISTVVAQIALGIATYLVTEPMTHDRAATMLQAWVPAFHVGFGAAILGMSTMRWLEARRDRLALPAWRRPVRPLRRGAAV